MIIEHVEALRSWLTDKLRPICDADPSALAKYVVALIKKEKPLDELADVCNDQLDVFLADETKTFVADLFEALETKSYLPSNSLMIQPTAQAPEIEPEAQTSPENAIKKEAEAEVSEALLDSQADSGINAEGEERIDSTENTTRDNEVDSKEKENLPEDGSKKGIVDFKDNDLERGHVRSHRNWRREKDFESSVDEFLNAKKPKSDWERSGSRGQVGRSISPNTRRSPRRQSPGRRHRSRRDRRRKSEERRSLRKRARCRDYDEKGFCLLGNSCPYDHGRDPVVVDDTSIPNILNMQGLPPALSAPPVPPLAQVPDMFPGIFQMPATTIVANPVASIQSAGLSLDTGLKLVVGQQRPVPTASELPQSLQLFSQPQPALTTIRPLLEEGKNEEGKKQADKVTEVAKSAPGGEAYNPEEPSIGLTDTGKKAASWASSQETANISNHSKDKFGATKFYPPASITAEQFLHRMYTPSPPLVPTPLAGVSLPDAVKSILQRSVMAAQVSALPMVSPLSVASLAPVSQMQNVPARRPFMNQTILEIRKIPRDSNTVVKLSEYFQKFGSIVNIQVNYENDPQAALIQFASNAEARRAYNSPEAVLGNRFIKLFWHNKTKNLPPTSNQAQLSVSHNATSNVASTTESNIPPTSDIQTKRPKLPSTGQTTYVNPQNTPEALQKKQAEMKKEALKKKLEIQKQRRLLLEKQIKEQKVLITKLEKTKNMSASEKQLLMTALKTLTISIEKLRTDLESQTKASKPMSKEDMQKEILDRDIELYNKQFTGEDPAVYKNALAEPPMEGNSHLASNQRPPGRGRARGRGRGAFAGRGRGFNPNNMNQSGTSAVVDNRPKQILVAGFEEQDKQAVVAQFASYGEIDKVDVKPGGKLVLSFHTRKQAEIAATKAALFNGKRLVLAWYNAAQAVKRGSASTPDDKPAKVQKRQTRKSSINSLLGDDTKEDSLLGDLEERDADLFLLEEDEEEDEERSWKR
ncbi:RNA-binding protein 27-like [Rhopilema esculentum]|uniref:RNA-binding protein 27-like n=1 Tax=Rhopilema esculentum TaxID=499914 RepID=UPI0031D2683D